MSEIVSLSPQQVELLHKLVIEFAPEQCDFDNWCLVDELKEINDQTIIGKVIGKYVSHNSESDDGEDKYIVEFSDPAISLLLALIDCLTDERIPDFFWDQQTKTVNTPFICNEFKKPHSFQQHINMFLNTHMLYGLKEK